MRLHRAVALLFLLVFGVSAVAKHIHAAGPRAERLPIKSHSRQARKLFEQAMVNLEALHTEQALEGCRAALRKDPEFAQALMMIAYLTQDPAEQNAVVSRAKLLQPRADEADRLLITWISSVSDGDTVKAIAAMNDLLSMYPNDVRLAFLAGRWLLLREQYGQSAALLERAVALHPDYPAAINELGYAYAGNGQYRKAFAMMERYAALEPKNPNPQDSYAEVLRLAGDYKAALQHYRLALQIDPTFVSSLLGIADTYALMGDEQAARDQYALAIDKGENQADRLTYELQSATTYVREHRYVQADQAFRAVAQEAHQKGFARIEAEAFRMMGWYEPRFASAMAALDEATQLLDAAQNISAGDRTAEQAEIMRVRVVRAARAGNDEIAAAITKLENLASSSRSHAVQRSYHGAVGALLVAQEKYAEAIPHLEEDVQNPLSLELLARAYDKAGMKDTEADLRRHSACLNQPTIEQALVAPDAQASLRPSRPQF